jgi:hypothetical protein
MKKIRVLVAFLIAIMMLESTEWTGLQTVAASQAVSNGNTDVWTSPLLTSTEQAACRKQLSQQSSQDSAVDATGGSVYPSIRAAAIYLRKQLKARATTITFQLDWNYLTTTDSNTIYNQVLEEALKPTTDPQEGDYIRYHLAGYSPCLSQDEGAGFVTYKLYCSYYTTAGQEKKVQQKIRSIISGLNLVNCSDAEKIKKIHDYLCNNVNYYDNGVVFGSKSCHSAYSALIGKKTVCQGYATAFYALCIQAGISVRCVQGIANTGAGTSGNHLWNVVKLGSKWYNIDVTWDDQNASDSSISYDYFMKNNAVFNQNHKRFYYFNNANQKKRYWDSTQIATFNAACPMSSVSYKNTVGKPSIQNITYAGNNAMRLTWNKVDTATGYYFYYAMNQTDLNNCKPIAIKGGNVTSLKMVGMVPGKTYYFKMRAYSDLFTSIKSKYSATVRVTY